MGRTANLLAGIHPTVQNATLLLMRVLFGGLIALGHGWGKLVGFSQGASSFPDPLGMGSHLSMAAAVFAEFFCGLLLILGLLTRPAAFVLAFNMAVAAFVVHASDPFFMPPVPAKEPAFLYLAGFACLALFGPGRYSLDALILRRSRSPRVSVTA
jgi:putative oxidoreductase